MATRGGVPSEQELAYLEKRGGPARNYVSTLTGEIYSRRQVEKAERAYGIRQEPLPTPTSMSRYNSLLTAAAETHGTSRGQMRNSEEFKQIIRDVKTKSDKAHGRKAKALEYIGFREEDADYDVGETPPRE